MSAPLKVTLPPSRAVDSGDHIEERRLARAVGADQTDDFAGHHCEVETVERHHAAEPPGQPARLQQDSVMPALPGK